MLLATDWPAFGAGLPRDLVKGACAIGGIFDLEPIRLSFLNKTLHLTPGQVARHSPLRQTDPVRAPLLLVVAAEMIGAQYGIGAFVLQAGNLMQTDQLMAGVVMLSVLGLLIAWGLGMVERSVLRWR